jgi:hypothetical protein
MNTRTSTPPQPTNRDVTPHRTATTAVELSRALVAVLPRCRYCGDPCEAEFCPDRDCDRLYRGNETTIREGYGPAAVGAAVGCAA